MDAKTQIIVLLFSYFYGFFFFYLAYINKKIIDKKNKIYRSLITTLFMYNIVLIYIIIIYKINNGKFHIYFFIMIIIGFITSIKFQKKLLKNVKLRSLLEKRKKKCYTIKK